MKLQSKLNDGFVFEDMGARTQAFRMHSGQATTERYSLWAVACCQPELSELYFYMLCIFKIACA